ncbi:MAG: PA14 domain-containing protein [Anaerolineae bacterium]
MIDDGVGGHDLPAGVYRFRVYADDGVRLWVDGRLLIEAWVDPQMAWLEETMELEAGYHFIQMEYYEAFGAAAVQLSWEPLSKYAYLPLIQKLR